MRQTFKLANFWRNCILQFVPPQISARKQQVKKNELHNSNGRAKRLMTVNIEVVEKA